MSIDLTESSFKDIQDFIAEEFSTVRSSTQMGILMVLVCSGIRQRLHARDSEGATSMFNSVSQYGNILASQARIEMESGTLVDLN